MGRLRIRQTQLLVYLQEAKEGNLCLRDRETDQPALRAPFMGYARFIKGYAY